jgi:hypothetical protein
MGLLDLMRPKPEPDTVGRLEEAKGLIEKGFTAFFYEYRGSYCAIGAYAKGFAKRREPVLFQFHNPEVIDGIRLLNEAAFIVSGKRWDHIENLALALNDKEKVLAVYDKAIELAEGRIARGQDPVYDGRAGGSLMAVESTIRPLVI